MKDYSVGQRVKLRTGSAYSQLGTIVTVHKHSSRYDIIWDNGRESQFSYYWLTRVEEKEINSSCKSIW